MTARDFLDSAASLLVMLAMIIICLLFAVYDRLAGLIGGHRDGLDPGGIQPTIPALVWRFGNSPDQMEGSERISESPATLASH